MSFVPPNEDELAAVERLKVKVNDELKVLSEKTLKTTTDESTEENYKPLQPFTDIKFLRFYRGMKRDEEKAYESLMSHAHWMVENNVDNINQNTALFQRELDAKKVIILDGLDNNGRPVSMCYVHRHDARDRNPDEVKMLIIHTLENLIKKAKPSEEKFVICFDLSRFTMRCMDYECVKILISIIQNNFPETLFTCLVIDSPLIFAACWYIIKPWLDPVTQEKVVFIKRAELSKYLDPALVPTDL